MLPEEVVFAVVLRPVTLMWLLGSGVQNNKGIYTEV